MKTFLFTAAARLVLNGMMEKIRLIKWGEWSLIALFLSALSGMVVGLQYNPATPLYSASALDLLVPFGDAFRALHFYSSQFFFLFVVLHLWTTLDSSATWQRWPWFRLIATLPVILLLLFTGYVLRGDSTGASAGLIAENIIKAIPLLGEPLNSLLFSISDDGMQRVFINHVIGLGLLFGVLAWEHLRRYRTSFHQHPLLTAVLLLLCILPTAPFEQEQLGVFHIAGPWFFLGLQELLKYFPPLLAGILYPGSFMCALFFLQKGSPAYPKTLLFVQGWLIVYAILSLIALSPFAH